MLILKVEVENPTLQELQAALKQLEAVVAERLADGLPTGRYHFSLEQTDEDPSGE